MPSLAVTPSQLEQLGGATHHVSADVRAAHQRLRGMLTPLFGADWSGTAAAQFEGLFADFDAHARGLSDALDAIAGLLVRAGTAYTQVEQDVTASFR